MSLADKLKELRKSKNVSQEKLAEYLGVSYQAVSKWENGVTSPDILLLPDIARYYGITVVTNKYLIGILTPCASVDVHTTQET